ncbi:MAG TPA: DUF4384 domain-containing protein [Gemmatimonadaceae bacterium]
MLSVLLVPLLLSGAAPATPVAMSRAATSDPTVRISLDHDSYDQGDRARAKVQIRDDGYLVVLHVSPDGLVRVLFPIDPTDDNFVRGGKSYEIRGRGDREAFTVGGAAGTGTIYAAWSGQPYHFDEFTRDGHWDYTVLGDSALATDPETGFTNLVGRMASGHFDYDLATYTVGQQVASYSRRDYVAYPAWTDPWAYPYSYDPYFSGYGDGGFGLGIGFGFGNPYYYSSYYYSPFYSGYYSRPYFGGCFYCGPVVVYRPFGGGPFRWKGGIPGGGPFVGVRYRPRSVLGPNAFASAPAFRGTHFRGPGVATPWRTPGASVSGFARQPVLRPTDLQGGRRVPVSLGAPTGRSNGERTVFAEPGRVNAGPVSPGERGSRAVPDRPRYEPSTRVAQPTRVSRPPTRTEAAPTRVSEPRVSEPRATPAPRVVQPAGRRPEMRYESQPRFEPSARAVQPRFEAPRAVQPRFEAPRAVAPRVERSSGGFSAPRAAPRASEPRMSAPRASSFGGGRRGGGGGGGGHRH